MGSRVHYVVVRDGVAVKVSRGGGHGLCLDVEIAVGPDETIRTIDAMAAADEAHHDASEATGWFGDTLCEGAVLLDVDARRLLFFTTQPWSEHPGDDYEQRAGLLDGLSRTWPGWRIDWAYDGVADIVGHLGEDAGDPYDTAPAPDRLYAPGEDTLDAILTLVTVDGVGYGLGWTQAPAAEYGVRLLDLLAGRDRLGTLPYPPGTGLHLDTTRRHADLWTIQPLRGLAGRWSRLWPGWRLDFHQDRYRRGGFALPAPDVDRGRRALAARCAAIWPTNRAYAIYRDTVETGLRLSYGLPDDERRAVRRRTRQAAEAAMPAAVAGFQPVADDIARRLR